MMDTAKKINTIFTYVFLSDAMLIVFLLISGFLVGEMVFVGFYVFIFATLVIALPAMGAYIIYIIVLAIMSVTKNNNYFNIENTKKVALYFIISLAASIVYYSYLTALGGLDI